MSVVLVIHSEEQLQLGATWCEQIAATAETGIKVIVVGAARKTLAELVRRRFAKPESKSNDSASVHCIEADVPAIMAHVQSVDGTTMVIVHRGHDVTFQKELFEASQVRSIWVQTPGPPPTSSDHVYVALRGENLVATLCSEKMFGFAPGQTLCESVDDNGNDRLPKLSDAISHRELDADDLVLFGVSEANPSNETYKLGQKLFADSPVTNVAIVHAGHSVAENFAMKMHDWFASVAPPMERQHRIDLARDLELGSKPNLEFLGLMSAASMLAAFGLLQDSAAVIIGAMLIAPLMTPIMGAGLALSHGNRPLFQTSLLTIVLGFLGALGASMLFGWLFWIFDEPTVTPEMWARCRPSPLDFCVGLVGGIAASYARTRSHLSSALAGAAIAAALVPPISTAGLQIAFGVWRQGPNGIPVVGPLLLVAVNVLTIMIGSSFVLWARGMRSDRQLGLKVRWSLRMLALLMTLLLLVLMWMVYQ